MQRLGAKVILTVMIIPILGWGATEIMSLKSRISAAETELDYMNKIEERTYSKVEENGRKIDKVLEKLK